MYLASPSYTTFIKSLKRLRDCNFQINNSFTKFTYAHSNQYYWDERCPSSHWKFWKLWKFSKFSISCHFIKCVENFQNFHNFQNFQWEEAHLKFSDGSIIFGAFVQIPVLFWKNASIFCRRPTIKNIAKDVTFRGKRTENSPRKFPSPWMQFAWSPSVSSPLITKKPADSVNKFIKNFCLSTKTALPTFLWPFSLLLPPRRSIVSFRKKKLLCKVEREKKPKTFLFSLERASIFLNPGEFYEQF